MDQTHGRGTAVLWLTVGGVLLACAAAVIVDVRTAAIVLALLCAVLAVARWSDRRPVALFRARSTPFDVTALAVAAVALAVLAQAGNLT